MQRICRLGFMTLLFSLLVACVVSVTFTAPSAVQTQQAAVFDASGNTIKTGIQPIYRWDFGDGEIASGVKVSHIYAKPGDYTVRLTVTDSLLPINTGVGSRSIKVTAPAVASRANLRLRVVDPLGDPVAGATVLVGENSAVSSGNGIAVLNNVPSNMIITVTANKSGYVPQALRTNIPSNISAVSREIVLRKIEKIINIANASNNMVLSSSTLHATVNINGGSLVDANGNSVSGAVTAEFTPYNVASRDINAMPGEGVGIDVNGQLSRLFSYGMLSVELKQGNKKLQLANGVTATLQIDLPIRKNADGSAIRAGQTIPMWHFNETTGVWVQEGSGQVVTSSASTTGLAVQATVSHFSIWNWDLPLKNPEGKEVSFKLRCAIDDNGTNTPAPCHVKMTARNDDGSVYLVKDSPDIDVAGVTIILGGWKNIDLVGTSVLGINDTDLVSYKGVVEHLDTSAMANNSEYVIVLTKQGSSTAVDTNSLEDLVPNTIVSVPSDMKAAIVAVADGSKTSALVWGLINYNETDAGNKQKVHRIDGNFAVPHFWVSSSNLSKVELNDVNSLLNYLRIYTGLSHYQQTFSLYVFNPENGRSAKLKLTTKSLPISGGEERFVLPATYERGDTDGNGMNEIKMFSEGIDEDTVTWNGNEYFQPFTFALWTTDPDDKVNHFNDFNEFKLIVDNTRAGVPTRYFSQECWKAEFVQIPYYSTAQDVKTVILTTWPNSNGNITPDGSVGVEALPDCSGGGFGTKNFWNGNTFDLDTGLSELMFTGSRQYVALHGSATRKNQLPGFAAEAKSQTYQYFWDDGL